MGAAPAQRDERHDADNGGDDAEPGWIDVAGKREAGGAECEPDDVNRRVAAAGAAATMLVGRVDDYGGQRGAKPSRETIGEAGCWPFARGSRLGESHGSRPLPKSRFATAGRLGERSPRTVA